MSEYYIHTNSPEEQERIKRFVAWALGITFAVGVTLVVFIIAARWWLPLIPLAVEKRFADRYVHLVLSDSREENQAVQAYLTSLLRRLEPHMELPDGFETTVHSCPSPSQRPKLHASRPRAARMFIVRLP